MDGDGVTYDVYLTPDVPASYESYITVEQLQRRFSQGTHYSQWKTGTFKGKTTQLKNAAQRKAEYLRQRERFDAIRKGKTGMTQYMKLRVVLASLGQDKCQICGQGPRQDLGKPFGDGLEVHHIVALAYGGGNVIENFCVLCISCHDAVHAGIPEAVD